MLWILAGIIVISLLFTPAFILVFLFDKQSEINNKYKGKVINSCINNSHILLRYNVYFPLCNPLDFNISCTNYAEGYFIVVNLKKKEKQKLCFIYNESNTKEKCLLYKC
jgi:hypothetical protein